MFIFSIPGSQYEGKVSRQLCSATFDRDGMISRLHMRESVNLVPFGDMKGSDKTSLSEKSKLLTYSSIFTLGERHKGRGCDFLGFRRPSGPRGGERRIWNGWSTYPIHLCHP